MTTGADVRDILELGGPEGDAASGTISKKDIINSDKVAELEAWAGTTWGSQLRAGGHPWKCGASKGTPLLGEERQGESSIRLWLCEMTAMPSRLALSRGACAESWGGGGNLPSRSLPVGLELACVPVPGDSRH